MNNDLRARIDEMERRAEAEWRVVRAWLWAGVAIEALGWFAALLALRWFVNTVVGW